MRRLKGFLLAVTLLLALVSAYPALGRCQDGCFCYMADYSGGNCGTISDSGCIVIRCIY